MIYLAHPTGAIEIAETDESAARLVSRGYVHVSYKLHRILWLRGVRQQQAALPPVSATETAPLASGWTRYGVDGKEIK